MLCPSCRRQLERGASYCGSCGAPLNGAPAPLELVLDGGRAGAGGVGADDRARARVDARAAVGPVGVARRTRGSRPTPCWRTSGSSHGTWLDGVRVTGPLAAARRGEDPARRRRAARGAPARAGARPGGRCSCPRARRRSCRAIGGTQFGMRPRVRSGYALKRLDASEGRQRWVLEGHAHRDVPAALGQRRVGVRAASTARTRCVELVAMCEQRFGTTGSARLVRLLDRPRRARLPGGRRGRAAAGGGADVVVAAADQAAREDLHRARPADRGDLPGAAAGCSSRGRR